MAWTEGQVEDLKKLWAEGLSASRIAAQIGGITRNAVIGKIHRLGLAARDVPLRPASRSQQPRAKAKTMPTAVKASVTTDNRARKLPDPSLPTVGTTSVLRIRDSMCKWPLGDPDHPDFGFCGLPRRAGSSYCEGHAEMAFQPVRKREIRSDDTAPKRKNIAG